MSAVAMLISDGGTVGVSAIQLLERRGTPTTGTAVAAALHARGRRFQRTQIQNHQGYAALGTGTLYYYASIFPRLDPASVYEYHPKSLTCLSDSPPRT